VSYSTLAGGGHDGARQDRASGGNVAYVTNTQFTDNGDNDGLPDNNECVTMDVTIQNNLATPLTNAKVTIVSNSPNVDLIPDDHALYGTVNAGSNATNPASDRFTFRFVKPANAPPRPIHPRRSSPCSSRRTA
jgi:hypothetical protein